MSSLTHLSAVVAFLVLGCGGGSMQGPRSEAPSARRPTAELIDRGREAASRGDSVRAEQYLSLAIEQGAAPTHVLPLLLDACLKSSHLRAALNHAEPYLRQHPENDALRYLVANIHVSLGQVMLAKRELGLLLQRHLENADAHYLMGIIESSTDLDLAREHFSAALATTRDEERRIEVRSRLAELQLRERELTTAARIELPERGGTQ